MADLLLELFSEEIPARMQQGACEQLSRLFSEALSAARLETTSIQTFVSPRHLAIRIHGLPTQQPDISTERKGPKIDAPDAALQGFLKSTGLSKEALEVREVGKDKVYFATIHEKGKPTTDVLKPMIEGILQAFTWPKSMRWGAHDIAWVRPLQNILCLFDSAVIPVQFGHLTANNLTYGHRFLAPAAITIASPSEYESKLEVAKVLVDREKRKAKIAADCAALAAQHKLTVNEDEGLLQEVTGLVEWPNPVLGSFDESFMQLPPEVLVSEMRHHQKYFALRSNGAKERAEPSASEASSIAEVSRPEQGQITNHFIATANMITNDGGKAVIHGNSRVLRARLSDGQFFWDQDRKTSLSDWAKGLQHVIFHASVGTVAEKVSRIISLSQELTHYVPKADAKKVARAAELCKADLLSGMVGEFPDLQGLMGRYYAIAQKEDAEVADAIRDHYKPAGAGDALPTSPTAICVSLADKLDSLVTLFAAGEKPTGSKDPFALRRSALGIIRIILENKLRASVRHLVTQSYALFKKDFDINAENETQKAHEKVINEIVQFFADRLKVMLKDQGIRHDVVAAIMAQGDEDLVSILAKAKALQAFLSTEDGTKLLSAYRRAKNIVSKETAKDKVNYFLVDPDESLFQADTPEERTLYTGKQAIFLKVGAAFEKEDFTEVMQLLSQSGEFIHPFLDKVLINHAAPDIRKNRLALCAQIPFLLDDSLADFSLIEG